MHKRNNSSATTYNLNAMLRGGGMPFKLIGRLEKPDLALFLEQKLESVLGIRDVPIPGSAGQGTPAAAEKPCNGGRLRSLKRHLRTGNSWPAEPIIPTPPSPGATMSKLTVQNAINNALKTPKGHAQVSKAEAEAIAKAALTESSGKPHVTASEAKLIGQLLHGDSFEGTKFQLTAPARKALEAFAAAQGLPIGSNAEAVKAQLEGVLASVDQGAPLAKAPATSSLIGVTLSDDRPSCGALREALLNPTKGEFYLRSTVQGRGMPKPQVSYYGPFPVKAEVTPQPPGAKLTAAELEAQLPKVADGYMLMSETDVTLRWLTGPKADVTAENVRSSFAAAHDAQAQSMFGTTEATPLAGKYAEEVPAEEFFTRYSVPYDPGDEYCVSSAAKFANVVSLLKANLTDLHVYRFSEGKPGDNIQAPGEVSIFIAGKTAAGELVSVMTAAVET